MTWTQDTVTMLSSDHGKDPSIATSNRIGCSSIEGKRTTYFSNAPAAIASFSKNNRRLYQKPLAFGFLKRDIGVPTACVGMLLGSNGQSASK